MITLQLTEKQAEVLYGVLIAVDDATHPYDVALEGEPFEGAPAGRKRYSLRRVWWKVAKALGYAE